MPKKAKYDWGKSRGKYQKFETGITLKLDMPTNTQDSVYVDTAQCLSLINRKLVRQGHVFSISNMRAFSKDTDAEGMDFSASCLPRTWMVFNAYKKARSLWNTMNLDAIQALGAGNLPKYYDFKVLYDVEHFKNEIVTGTGDYGVEGNLLPVDQQGNAATAGEWVYSFYEDSQASADKFYGHMLGTHCTETGAAEGAAGRDTPADGGSAGLVLAYQQSRGAAFTDQDVTGLDQQVDADSPWAMLFGADDQSQQVLTALDVDNDGPPYPADYSGAVMHPEGRLVGISYMAGGNSSAFSTTMPFRTFEAPLGLIKLDLNRVSASADVSDVWITFDARILGAI